MLLGMSLDGSAILPSLPQQSVRAYACALLLIGGGSCHAFVQSASAFAAAVVAWINHIMRKSAGLTAVAAVIGAAVFLLTLYVRDWCHCMIQD